jgi:integrase
MANERRPRGSGGLSFDQRRNQWRITWPIPNDRPGSEYVDGSRIDAERALRRRLQERDAGAGRADHRITVERWIREWLGSHVAAKSTGTRIRYADISERVIIPAIGRQKLADLDDRELARFKASMIRAGRTPRGADSVMDVLSAALGQAVTSGVLGSNPRRAVKRERPARRLIDPPTRAECDAMLAAVADQPVWYALFALTIGHGLRQSEVLGLRRRDRSADGRVLRIERKREYRTGSLAEEPKDGSTRLILLKPWIAEALDRLGPGDAESLLFPGARDASTPIHPHTLLDRVHELSEVLGLRRRFTWHDLRRAFGTRIAAGNSVATITSAMGHRDFRTSLLYIAADELVDDMPAPGSAPLTAPLRQTRQTPRTLQTRTKRAL